MHIYIIFYLCWTADKKHTSPSSRIHIQSFPSTSLLPGGRSNTTGSNKAPQWEQPRCQSSAWIRTDFWSSTTSSRLFFFHRQPVRVNHLRWANIHPSVVLDKLLLTLAFCLWVKRASFSFMKRLSFYGKLKKKKSFCSRFQEGNGSWSGGNLRLCMRRYELFGADVEHTCSHNQRSLTWRKVYCNSGDRIQKKLWLWVFIGFFIVLKMLTVLFVSGVQCSHKLLMKAQNSQFHHLGKGRWWKGLQ